MSAKEVDQKLATAEVSAASPKPTSGGGSSSEFEPPLACVRRMLKNALPTNTNVGKDASFAFSRACGIFIIYLTACANDFAREHKRQTITANDILAAVKELDFDEFTPQLESFIELHRVAEKKKKAEKATAKREKEEQGGDENEEEDDDQSQGEPSSPSAKRRKVASGALEEEEEQDNDASLNETIDDQEEDNDSQADAGSQDDNDSQENEDEDEDEMQDSD